MFDGINSDIIIYGHDHRRNICKGDKLYVNVGSLGCPSKDINIARAGVIEIEKRNVEIETIDVKYDVDSVIDAINEIDYPESDNIKKFFYGIW